MPMTETLNIVNNPVDFTAIKFGNYIIKTVKDIIRIGISKIMINKTA